MVFIPGSFLPGAGDGFRYIFFWNSSELTSIDMWKDAIEQVTSCPLSDLPHFALHITNSNNYISSKNDRYLRYYGQSFLISLYVSYYSSKPRYCFLYRLAAE